MATTDRTAQRRFDVRRLAAVDMHAMSGTDLRRRVIIAEYLGAATVGCGIGLFLLLATDDALGRLIGLYALAVGLNYVPAVRHSLALCSRRRLEAEVAGVDMEAELRYYNPRQFLVFVPLLFLWFELRKRRTPRSA